MQLGPAPKLQPVSPVETKFTSMTPIRISTMGATQGSGGSSIPSLISASPVTALSGKFPVLATYSSVLFEPIGEISRCAALLHPEPPNTQLQSLICVEIRGKVEAALDCRSAQGDTPQEISHLAIRGLGMSDNGQLNPEGSPRKD